MCGKREGKSKFGAVVGLFTAVAAASAAAAAVYAYVVRPWHLRWGASDDEVTRPLPGDDRVPGPKSAFTHGVTINATPQAIWPWLAQWGYGRGGFYSYDWIDHAVGATGVASADRILPEFQNLAVGDKLPVAPEEGGFTNGFTVVALEPDRYLLLEPAVPEGEELPFCLTWLWHLEPVGEGQTRLISRMRADWEPGKGIEWPAWLFMEPGSFVMDRKMLLGIKARVEGTHTPAAA